MQRWVGIASLMTVLAALLVVSGCAGKKQATTKPTTKVAGRQEQASTVTATLTKSALTVAPASVPAGLITISVDNKSTTAHDVAVKGPGVAAPVTKSIPANSTGTLTLEKATAGKYTIYVVGMEKTPAMSKTFTVTAAKGTATATSPKKEIVNVTLMAKSLTLNPASIPAGYIELRVKNSGKTDETVAVKGPGLTTPMTKTVKANATETILLDNAQPGKHTVYVVGKEKMAGMSKTFTVTKAKATTTTGTATKKKTTGYR